MSSILYRTRIFFDAHRSHEHRGSAKVEEVEVQLYEAPQIPGLPEHITLLDYAPQVRCYEIRESSNQRRDMTKDEIRAAETWLSSIAKAVRHIIRR